MPIHPQQFEILTRARSDALPEHAQYRDDGCDIYPHCLTCPLPRCRYDEPGGLRSILIAGRDEDVVKLRLQGESVDRLASRFHVSRRTVFRILARSDNGEAGPLKVAPTWSMHANGESLGSQHQEV